MVAIKVKYIDMTKDDLIFESFQNIQKFGMHMLRKGTLQQIWQPKCLGEQTSRQLLLNLVRSKLEVEIWIRRKGLNQSTLL